MTTTEITTAPSSYGYQPGEGRRLWVVGDTLTFKATAAQTGGSMAAVEILAAPGGGPPPHVHANEDEMWFVLDGEFEILHGDETLRLTAGGFAFVPRGTLHRFENVSDTPRPRSHRLHPRRVRRLLLRSRRPGRGRRVRATAGARGDRAQPRRGHPLRHGSSVAAGDEGLNGRSSSPSVLALR